MLITFIFSIKSFLKWFTNTCPKVGIELGGPKGLQAPPNLRGEQIYIYILMIDSNKNQYNLSNQLL